MTPQSEFHINVEETLAQLMDFQRDTAEYAFRRLYLDENPANRFLIADEVGLGKTLVARGVIVQALAHLWESVDRLDVLYVCSNSDIARQNIGRLTGPLSDEYCVTRASRLTLLPLSATKIGINKVNFLALTPGTSFELKSSLGVVRERALLYRLLQEAWSPRGSGSFNILRGYVGKNVFQDCVHDVLRCDVNRNMVDNFFKALAEELDEAREKGQLDLRTRFEVLCRDFRRSRQRWPEEQRRDRNSLVGDLRILLARSCLDYLEPDLIILDEFQRFKPLLDKQGEAGELAHELFTYAKGHSRAKVLLLSATPYKMYTLASDQEDNHYQDFIKTLEFLYESNAATADLSGLLDRYRSQIYHLRFDGESALDELVATKNELERMLRQVMARTERLSLTEDRDGMLSLVERPSEPVESQDIDSYLEMQRISDSLGKGDILEYWKASPYLLEFMDGYELKKALPKEPEGVKESPSDTEPSWDGNAAFYPWRQWSEYREIGIPNPRMRQLVADTVNQEAWRMLWLPPSLPYYRSDGVIGRQQSQISTKRLIFSSWRVVPKAISAMVSYEAERRMVRLSENSLQNSAEARKGRSPLLRFGRGGGGPSGLPVLGLMYPGSTLASVCDPLVHVRRIMQETGADIKDLPSLSDILARIEPLINHELSLLRIEERPEGPRDDRWYWVAPILLDLSTDRQGTLDWLDQSDLASKWTGGEADQQEHPLSKDHLDYTRKLVKDLLDGGESLGPKPADLATVLAKLGLASPGVAAFRALVRTSGANPSDVLQAKELRNCAAQVAWALRNLFNHPEVIALIRGLKRKGAYWKRVLEYCAEGGLQAVLDEYCHMLRESLGLSSRSPSESLQGMSNAIRHALGVRTSNLSVDKIIFDPVRNSIGVSRNTRHMRARFALRFGDEKAEIGNETTRRSQVMDSFNSPFWPFVLATTSVGQEGLDFHHYCHAVMHWDLPSNPVDLEQREGRVHRYKGHAVRKNLARAYWKEALAPDNSSSASTEEAVEETVAPDPWRPLFEAGKRDRDSGASDIVPYWVFQVEGGAKIERHVPHLPLSRDTSRLHALQASLAIYRLAFGQPRQDDLVDYLLANLPQSDIPKVMDRLSINLSPPAC